MEWWVTNFWVGAVALLNQEFLTPGPSLSFSGRGLGAQWWGGSFWCMGVKASRLV